MQNPLIGKPTFTMARKAYNRDESSLVQSPETLSVNKNRLNEMYWLDWFLTCSHMQIEYKFEWFLESMVYLSMHLIHADALPNSGKTHYGAKPFGRLFGSTVRLRFGRHPWAYIRPKFGLLICTIRVVDSVNVGRISFWTNQINYIYHRPLRLLAQYSQHTAYAIMQCANQTGWCFLILAYLFISYRLHCMHWTVLLLLNALSRNAKHFSFVFLNKQC
jgi:hypothetical protein